MVKENLLVKKTNGNTIKFLGQKIINAILAANQDGLSFDQVIEITESIENKIPDSLTIIDVNELHKHVYSTLAEQGYMKTAVNYQNYRNFRKEMHKELTQISKSITQYPKPNKFSKPLIESMEDKIQRKQNHIQNKYEGSVPQKMLDFALIQELTYDEDFMTLSYFIQKDEKINDPDVIEKLEERYDFGFTKSEIVEDYSQSLKHIDTSKPIANQIEQLEQTNTLYDGDNGENNYFISDKTTGETILNTKSKDKYLQKIQDLINDYQK